MDAGSADHARHRRADGRDCTPIVRVMLVAGHRTIRLALRQALEALGVEVTTDAPPGKEALVAALSAHPHVVLVDVATDAVAGIETCRQLHEAMPATRVVALAPRLGASHEAARTAGATAVVTTDASVADLATALATSTSVRRRRPAPGPASRPVLTSREQEVLELVAKGLTDGQISRALFISPKTVKNHLHHVYGKLGASGRTDAVMVGLRHHLIAV